MRLLRLIVSRPVVARSLVTVLVAIVGSGIPRLVATLVGVIAWAVFGMISVIPGFAAIAAGESKSGHHHQNAGGGFESHHLPYS